MKIKTEKDNQIIDITDKVENKISDNFTGIVHIFVKHTTCFLSTADLDPGTASDILRAIQKIVPKLDYNHPHNPEHVWEHIASTIFGPSLSIPVKKGKLNLGTWQRVILIELSGPREREIIVTTIDKSK